MNDNGSWQECPDLSDVTRSRTLNEEAQEEDDYDDSGEEERVVRRVVQLSHNA